MRMKIGERIQKEVWESAEKKVMYVKRKETRREEKGYPQSERAIILLCWCVCVCLAYATIIFTLVQIEILSWPMPICRMHA